MPYGGEIFKNDEYRKKSTYPLTLPVRPTGCLETIKELRIRVFYVAADGV